MMGKRPLLPYYTALHCCAALLVAASPSLVAGEPLALPFTLAKPAGGGPFPAVVILHDCTGLGPKSSGAPWRWSSMLTQRGFVTIWPDSFSTRGHPAGVCTGSGLPRVTYQQRAHDAYAALNHLRDLPYVDITRVAVMGGSHGGSSTLATIVEMQNARTEATMASRPRSRSTRIAAGRSAIGGSSAPTRPAGRLSNIPAPSSRKRRS